MPFYSMLLQTLANAFTTFIGWFPYVVSPVSIMPSMCSSNKLAMSPISVNVGLDYVNIDSNIYVEMIT